MTGPSLGQTQTIVNAIKMAFEEANYKVGNFTIEYEALDDATPAKQNWDAAKEAQNARAAVADAKIVAYIGTYNSGAAAVSIPILCQAGLAMISPANTYAGLTKAGKGEADEPGKYYPGGCKRNYSRVVPADDLQGAVGARWVKELGGKSVYILHDDELYGKGLADVFRAEAKKIGLTEAGYEGAPKADNFRTLANKVAASNADFVYYSGLTYNNPGFLLRDLKAARPGVSFMSVDGVAETEFLNQAGVAAEGAYITFGGVPVDAYTGKSREWAERYRAKYGANPEVYSIYGYEAAKVVLEAIRKAGSRTMDRATVRDNIMATKDFDGVLGDEWSFTPEGDTTITTMAGMVIRSRDFHFSRLLSSATGSTLSSRPAAPIDVNDPKYDPAGQVIGTQHPDEGNAHLQPGERGSYGTIPPTSGAHWGAPAAPATWGIKDSELPDEVTTHNLEHGGLIISYKALSAEDTAKLKDLVRLLTQNGYPKIILQPYAKMNDARIALSAWRWQLKLATYEDVPIVKFVRAHYQGPDAPERLVR